MSAPRSCCQVFFGVPIFLLPSGFQFKACLVMLLFGFVAYFKWHEANKFDVIRCTHGNSATSQIPFQSTPLNTSIIAVGVTRQSTCCRPISISYLLMAFYSSVCKSVASRQGRQGRQSLGAPEWKGPPSRVLIFLRTRQLTDVSSSSAHRCVGLRHGARAAIEFEQLIWQHTKGSDPKLSQCRNRNIIVQMVAPPCACWAAAFFDVVDPGRFYSDFLNTPL